MHSPIWLTARRDERDVGRWALVPQGGDEASVWHEAGEVGDPGDLADRLLAEARARRWRVVARIAPEHLDLQQALAARGWTREGERVDWAVPISSLPGPPADDPAQWRSVRRVGLEPALEVLAAAAPHDPLGPSRGAPDGWLRGWLDAPNLQGDLQVGYVSKRPAVLTGAQVNPRTGWSRIPYMGVAPWAWGRGLGVSGLLRGFVLLRARGAASWSDGCAADNHRVLSMLAAWGVRPQRRSVQWTSPGEP